METWTLQDFDEYSSAIRNADLEMLLRNLVFRRWCIRHLEAAGVHLQHGNQGSGDITQGQALSDAYLLYVPLRNEAAQRANGVTLDARSIVLVHPGAEFHLSSNIDHAWCAVHIPSDQLSSLPREGASARGGCQVLHLTPKEANRYRGLVLRILAAVESYGSLESSPGVASAIQRLVQRSGQLLGGQNTTESANAGRPRLSREEIIRRANRALASPQLAPLTVADLAARCEVSERTLRSAFQDWFGVAPHRFLQMRRLHQVRRTLNAADPANTTLSEVLAQHGEWEFGRFAGRYRRTFGELPSETLIAKSR